ncbi:hypothetical protein ABZ135_23500 [Streptomyces sp. NPDC006339]|uniref:hypothetical protein n=1 Tax=Streptomyces sp. NPDC006339 TaxID=3156755 RepID=UPI0033B10446
MGEGHRTVATVVRAGPRTVLVSLSGWHRGQVLAPVGTRVLAAAGGQVTPGSRYWVTGNLDAVLDTGLALRDWEPA